MQWPHHGAKTVAIVSSAIEIEGASVSKGIRTLSKDEVVLLNEALEVVRLQLLDVGCSNNGRKEGGANCRVLHFAVVECAIEVMGRKERCSLSSALGVGEK